MAIRPSDERAAAILTDILEQPGRALRCYKVQLLSNSRRTDAHVFYESLGFERSAEGFRRHLGHDVGV